MAQEYFPTIGKIPFEGTESKNPLAFHYYEPERIVCGKPMKEWLKFAMAWWHTLGQASADPFGGQTRSYAWDKGDTPYARARAKADAGFEIMQKLGIGYFCFHDIDLVEDCDDIAEYEARMKDITDYLLVKMKETGIKNLWGTANVFGHKRYMNGAGTNPQFDVVARAAVQIKNALDATIKLGGANYVFWGGREGYYSLLNTQMQREKDHLAQLLKAARDYARANGFKGTFLIEPKPMEPTKHQYDVDTETVLGFLRANGLDKDFKVNIEVNHATLGRPERLGYGPVPCRRVRTHPGHDADHPERWFRQWRHQLRRQAAPLLHGPGGHLHRPYQCYGCHGPCPFECRRRAAGKPAVPDGQGALCQLRQRSGQTVRGRQSQPPGPL